MAIAAVTATRVLNIGLGRAIERETGAEPPPPYACPQQLVIARQGVLWACLPRIAESGNRRLAAQRSA